MLRTILLFLMIFMWAEAAPHKFTSSENCKGCHGHIVDQWKQSWHARSHYEKNEYFKKSLEYVAKKRYKGIDSIKAECATCHNPRIGIKNLSPFSDIDHAFGTENKNSKLHKAVEDEILKEGINCIVCHKIAAIDDTKSQDKRGLTLLSWLKKGTIGGPFDDAEASYHESKQQKFFNNPDKLCLVCHENMETNKGFVIANTGAEFRKHKEQEKCVDCHMSPKKEGYAALTVNKHGVKVKRMVREHLFAGAHKRHVVKNALELQVKADKDFVYVTVHNPNPHSVPTGFGGRSIVIDLTWVGMKGAKIVTKEFTTHYTDRHNRATIPHLAVKSKVDLVFEPKATHTFKFPREDKAHEVLVQLSYKLVNDEIADLLELSQKPWREKTLIRQSRQHF